MSKRKIGTLTNNEHQKDENHSSTLGIKPSLKSSKCNVIPPSGERSKMDQGTFNKHMENIWKGFPEDKRAAFAHLDSLYFQMYQYPNKRKHALEQINKENIFSKKYVFVPIVCWGHWRLVIFCHFGHCARSKTRTRCMLLLDSAETCSDIIGPDLRKFVSDIFEAGGRRESKNVISQIPLLVPKVPQQKNDVDCGRFVLYFIKQFMETAPENFSSSKGYPDLITSEWFGPELFTTFCDKLDEEMPNLNQGVKRAPKRCSQRVRNLRAASAQKPLRRDKDVIVLDDSDTPSDEK